MKMSIPQFLSLIALVIVLVLLSIYVFPNVDWDRLVKEFRFNVADRTAVEDEFEETEEEEVKDDWL